VNRAEEGNVTDFDPKEAERRARTILDNAAREIEAARTVLNENPGKPDLAASAGSLLAQYGAMFEDACMLREPYAKGSRTIKVRKALGYTYP